MTRRRLPSIVLLLCASAAASQQDTPPDARAIVEKSISVEDKTDRLAVNYTFQSRNVIKEFDGQGSVKLTKTTGEEIVFLGGKRYVHVLTRDDKPLTGKDAVTEQQKFDRAVAEASKLSEAEKQKRLDAEIAQRRRNQEPRRLIPLAYNLKVLREETLNGRVAWVIHASPRKDYNGKYKEIFHNMEGDMWVDKSDYHMVKVQAHALDNFSLGWILARVSKDSDITFELTRVNGEVWLPRHVAVRADARIALFKKVNVAQEIFFSDYKRYSSDSRIVSSSEK